MLADIERANLFLVPLDDRREWYRYHHLFSELLRHELARVRGDEIVELHRRASRWLADSGAIDEAIRHACAAGDEQQAAALVTEQWRNPFNRGELTTVDSWLDQLPPAIVAESADLCLARAWVAMDRGHPQEAERWLAGATSGVGGESTVLHAVLCFKLGKIGHAERIAREAVDVADEDSPLGVTVALCILGIALYYRGAFREGASVLDRARGLALARANTLAHIYALGYLALTQLELDGADAARVPMDAALDLAAAPPASEHFVGATAHLARGLLERDEDALGHALALARRGAAPVEIAAVRLALGELRRDASILRAARHEIDDCEDPGRLPELIEAAEIALRGRQKGRRRAIAGDLSDRELAVLQLLPTDLSLRDIASSLYLSLNTVKTHTRSIYRKLGASSREEAVARGRELQLLGELEEDREREIRRTASLE